MARTGPGKEDMDGHNGTNSIVSRAHRAATEDKENDKKIQDEDKVTLKKEIGLLSACAIIIGEAEIESGHLGPALLFYIITEQL